MAAFLTVAALPLASWAVEAEAESGGTRRAVQAAITLEEARSRDLQALAAAARTSATDLEAQARARDASAKEFYARSLEFKSAAARIKGPSRATVTAFATAMNVYARTDQEMANASRKAGEIMQRQAKDADTGVQQHQKHVEQLRQSLEDWK
jgi:hypothetical protein